MKELKQVLNELGISKVKLAKYLGVSRQMVYNYLELDSINKWPKEKKLLLFKLLDIEDGDDSTLAKIKINTENKPKEVIEEEILESQDSEAMEELLEEVNNEEIVEVETTVENESEE